MNVMLAFAIQSLGDIHLWFTLKNGITMINEMKKKTVEKTVALISFVSM